MKRFLSLLMLTGFLFGQVEIEWSKTYGDEFEDIGRFVHQTNDSGFVVIGSIYNNDKALLIKTNTIGDTLWTKIYGGNPYAVKQTIDGDYIIIGSKEVYNESDNFWLIKTNSNGDSLWSQTYGGEDSDIGRSIIETDDGGYLLVGRTRSFTDSYSDLWLVKTNSNGDSLWSQTYGGSQPDFGFFITKSNNGGYLLVGTSASFGNGGTNYGTDIWLIKINDEGDSLWSKTYGGTDDEFSKYVYENDNGDLIIIGTTSSYGSGENDLWLVKANSNGDSLWSKTYGGIGNESSSTILDFGDNGYLIIGSTNSFGNDDYATWLIQTNSNGDSLWSQAFGGEGYGTSYYAEKTHDNGCMIVGTNSINTDASDIWLLKTSSIVLTTQQLEFPIQYSIYQNFPNPFNPVTTLRYDLPEDALVNITIYDMMGRVVRNLVSSQQNAGYKSIQWNATNNTGQPVSAGLYLYTIEAGDYI